MENNNDRPIKRRELLKIMTSVPAALVTLPEVEGAKRSHPKAASMRSVAGGYELQILSHHEYKTVTVLADLILPADERSGSASQAGVPEFIDDWLHFWKGDLLAELRGGLTWLDIESNEKYAADFVDCAVADQKQMLDRIAYPKKARPEDSQAVAFFNRFRDLVVGGFYSSQEGVKDLPYLGNTVVARWAGCPADVTAKIEQNEKKDGVKL